MVRRKYIKGVIYLAAQKTLTKKQKDLADSQLNLNQKSYSVILNGIKKITTRKNYVAK